MITSTLRTVAVFVATLGFLAPSSLWAAAIVIDDTSPNEVITFSANDFEGGLNLNGNPFQIGLNNPATATFPETGPLTFSGTWITNGQQGPVSGTIYLVESPFDATLPPPLISDILRFEIVSIPGTELSTITGFFDSSDNLGVLPVPFDPKDVFVETGNPVRLDFFGLTLQVASDVDIPEPSSICLAGFGLVGLATIAYRRRKQLA